MLLRSLKELESNAFAMLCALFVFLIVLFLIALIASWLFGVDWNAVLGIGGMATGNSGLSSISQTMSNRSPNYQPLVSSQPVAAARPGPLIP